MKVLTKFILNDWCFLIAGAKRGAIYDLKRGLVFSIDEKSLSLLAKCENGHSIYENLNKDKKEIINSILLYFKKLEENELGKFINKIQKSNKISIQRPRRLELVWLEITGRCNLNCIHCYMNGETQHLTQPEKMTKKNWIEIMRKIYTMDCQKLQFIGGEVFLNKDLFDLVLEGRKIGYKSIEIYTNATLLNNQGINFLSKNNVSVAVSIYGMNNQIHDKITKVNGSFEKSIVNLRKMISEGINVRVGIIGMSVNEKFLNETVKFLKDEIGVKRIKIDMVRPIGRGTSSDLSPKTLLNKKSLNKPEFAKCSLERFQRALYGNNCFLRHICISHDGNVFPCIMEREITLGNVLKESIEVIINNPFTEKIMRLNKDKIEVCKDCEYRYCCFDCRPKVKNSSNGNLYAKPPDCNYNPYTGKWNFRNRKINFANNDIFEDVN
ncbi:MAG: radical SAM protein [Candidatus Aminicenantes bacterium]|nr:radical SAM protein [Candidatus Aminicenantes bacterium]